MSLKEMITKDLFQAMREKDNRKKGVLQLLKAGLENAEKVKKASLEPSEEISMVQREVKQLKDSITEAQKGNREDVVQESKLKLEILCGYLPNQLNEDQVREQLVQLGVQKGMNMKQAMGIAMPALKGKTENALISKMVKQLIS